MATPTLPRAGARLLPGDTHHDPAHGERRRVADRRLDGDRRRARRDRRRGRPDRRAVPIERRQRPSDRRSGQPDRRLGGDRRGVLAAPAGAPALDPDVVFWAVNVVCWTAITVVALVWGA
ncbi:MAG: hypothetical protein E6G10_20400 [Actinobacteria bacterium]|nr:MAG: hypothetical protein E6G10_20400 [Actinomycetota bacterium]